MAYKNAPNSLGNTCQNCSFYIGKTCQLNPKTPLALPDGDIIFYYPEMYPDDWCSHHQPTVDTNSEPRKEKPM